MDSPVRSVNTELKSTEMASKDQAVTGEILEEFAEELKVRTRVTEHERADAFAAVMCASFGRLLLSMRPSRRGAARR